MLKNNTEIINEFINEVKGDIKLLILKIPNFIFNNEELIGIGGLIIKKFFIKGINDSKVIDFIKELIYYIVLAFSFTNKKFLNDNISTGCYDFLKYSLLGFVNDDLNGQLNLKDNKNISDYYIYKFFVDSAKK